MNKSINTLFKKYIGKIIPFSNAEVDYVLSHFTKKRFKKHQFIIQAGKNVTSDFFILSGCFKSYFTDNNGKEYILAFGVQGWWITDYQAFYYQTKATINVDCIEDSEVLCLSFENREKLCAEMHKMEHFFRKKTSRLNVALLQRYCLY